MGSNLLLEAWGKRGAQLPFADHCIACMCVGGGNRCLHPEVHEQTEKIDDVTLPSPLNHPCINFRLFEPGASRVRLLYPPLIFPFTHLASSGVSAGLGLRQSLRPWLAALRAPHDRATQLSTGGAIGGGEVMRTPPMMRGA